MLYTYLLIGSVPADLGHIEIAGDNEWRGADSFAETLELSPPQACPVQGLKVDRRDTGLTTMPSPRRPIPDGNLTNEMVGRGTWRPIRATLP